MGKETGIEWTDATWNPVTGCEKVSPGCRDCYAEGVSERMQKNPKQDKYVNVVNSDGHWTGEVHVHPDELVKPTRWTKPRRIFTCSMSDLFHEKVRPQFVGACFARMAVADHHVFQVLTKRPERMARMLPDEPRFHHDRSIQQKFTEGFVQEIRHVLADDGDTVVDVESIRELDIPWPLPNVWVGTSVEDQERVEDRLQHLVNTPSNIHFLSCEPLLDRINIWPCLGIVDWVIVGGESGPDARPIEPSWVSHVINQCRDNDVPVFVKQLGTRWAEGAGADDSKGGDPAEWPETLRVREWPPEADPFMEDTPA